jgi:Tol biopolymer transport system component
MTTLRRAADLPAILDELARGPYPDYIDDVLTSTAQRRQRPGWTFPKRWLPMVDIARAPVIAPRAPWRLIAIVALLLVLLAAVAAFIGARRTIIAPYGLASNGLVAYERGGDIYTVDPVTNAATAIVSGPGTDVGPRYSLDGTHLAFERKHGSGLSQIFVARADGSDVRLVTPAPLALAAGDSGRAWEKYEFSPDGTSLLIAIDDLRPGIAIARTDGGDLRVLEVGMGASEPSFRPPLGTEILFIGRAASGSGLFAVDTAGGPARSILAVPAGFDLAGASWSPDGSKIAYWSWHEAGGLTASSHIVNADGTDDFSLPNPPGAVWNAHATWSNDGTRLFIVRGFTAGFEDVRGFVLPADGSGVGVEVAPAGTVENDCCASWTWSPDDSKLLGRPGNRAGQPLQQIIIDLETGETGRAPWDATTDPTWQRQAP